MFSRILKIRKMQFLDFLAHLRPQGQLCEAKPSTVNIGELHTDMGIPTCNSFLQQGQGERNIYS